MSADHRDVLIDAHVHYHCGFSRPAFFDAARRNLDAGARQLGLRGSNARVLMLTESAGVDAFGRFTAEASRTSAATSGARATAEASPGSAAASRDRAAADPTAPAGGVWSFRQTGEGNSLWAVRRRADDEGSVDPPPGDGPATGERVDAPSTEILLVAGRQIVTRDRLEVLALGCRASVADGLPLRTARDAVIEAGGIPVIPWGFGKWWFSRGRRLAKLLGEDAPGRWFLGDNAGRPALGPSPRLFRRAARHGIFVLPGSDPLPLPGQESKTGRCGLVMPQPLDPRRPAASLLEWLRHHGEQPTTFGRYEDIVTFARHQLAMQRRHSGRDAAGARGSATPSGQASPPAARGDGP